MLWSGFGGLDPASVAGAAGPVFVVVAPIVFEEVPPNNPPRLVPVVAPPPKMLPGLSKGIGLEESDTKNLK